MVEFGTDGIRGVANRELTPELALALGRAVGESIGSPRVLVGTDTRRSGSMLKAAFTAGVMSAGCDVVELGVFPTGGIAYVARSENLVAAVISASHNPFQDNGIKIFGRGGRKLTSDQEVLLERRTLELLEGSAPIGAEDVGTLEVRDATSEYLEFLVGSVGPAVGGTRRLGVVIDCAHGSAFALGPLLFERLQCSVLAVVGASPDGRNINKGSGSTDLTSLVEAVRSSGADLGLAFDGDADRLLAVDEEGRVVDGDALLALFAVDMGDRKVLRGDGVVATVMSNMGLEVALKARSVELVRTQVGDRHVADALERLGYSLGGEQSGHIIFADTASTGDGLLTAARLVDLVRRDGRALGEMVQSCFRRSPQVLRSIPVADPKSVVAEASKDQLIAQVRDDLGEAGRVVIRASGTEALIRVMVEAETQTQAEAAAGLICKMVGELAASVAD
jgi:phosphoglucosamine mutase